MADGVENGEQDQAACACNSEDDCVEAQQNLLSLMGPGDLFSHAHVLRQPTGMPQPSFRGKSEIEENGCNAAAGDEERFEALSADIWSILVSFDECAGEITT
ncbi:MAG: hypothetical protein Q9179_000142 [Wetmoreana sp. 5 TL-2023]